MSRFKGESGKKELPPVSTASLPDIVFMLLFFFMVITVLKEYEEYLDVEMPTATELTKLENKDAVSHIYIGKIGDQYSDYRKIYGTAPVIQLNDQIAEESKIVQFVEMERSSIPPKFVAIHTFSLKVDKGVKMGKVSDVKQELRKADALKINYASLEDSEADS